MSRAFTTTAFIIVFLLVIISGMAKILRLESADNLLWIALAASWLCFGYVLRSIFFSTMHAGRKAWWLMGLFLAGWPVLLFYVFVTARKGRVDPRVRAGSRSPDSVGQ